MLGGLCLQLSPRSDVRHQSEMDIENVLLPPVPAKLPYRLQKGEPLNVSYGPAHLADRYVVAFRSSADAPLDLIRDMGNDLDRPAQVVSAALFGDDRFVDLPGRGIIPSTHRRGDIAFVVSQVEIGLCPVVGDKDLSVLVRAHRPRVDVDVRVHLEQGDLQPTALHKRPDRSRGQALAQGGYYPTGHKDEFGLHASHVFLSAPMFFKYSSAFFKSSGVSTSTEGSSTSMTRMRYP